MTIEEIMNLRESLERQLILALSNMERKDKIFQIKEELLSLQKQCPHYSAEHSFAIIDGKCPYCGRKIL